MPYLTAQQVRDRARSTDLNDTERFPDEDLEDYIAEFEEAAEDYCCVAFTTRETTTTADVCGNYLILKPKIIAVSELTLEGDAYTAYDTPTEVDAATGILRFTSNVSGLVSVTYTHGFETTPKVIERACVQYVRACALRDDTSTGRDVISQGFDGGQTRYSTPDKAAGRPTGYLEVDRLLNSAPMYTVPGIA